MLDATGWDDRCFIEGLDYSEDGAHYRYSKCPGVLYCATHINVADAYSCYCSKVETPPEGFADFLTMIRQGGGNLKIVFPARLCTRANNVSRGIRPRHFIYRVFRDPVILQLDKKGSD